MNSFRSSGTIRRNSQLIVRASHNGAHFEYTGCGAPFFFSMFLMWSYSRRIVYTWPWFLTGELGLSSLMKCRAASTK